MKHKIVFKDSLFVGAFILMGLFHSCKSRSPLHSIELLVESGRFLEAKRELDGLPPKKLDEDYSLLFWGGVIEKELGNYDAAAHYFNSAERIRTDDSVELYSELGEVYCLLDRCEDAQRLFDKHLDDLGYPLTLAQCYDRNGDFEMADSIVSKYLLVNQGDTKAKLIKAHTAINISPFQDAKEVVEDYLGDNSFPNEDKKVLHFYYSILHVEQNDFEKALKEATLSLGTIKDTPIEFYLLRANIWRKLGNYQNALNDAKMAQLISPESPEVFLSMGLSYFQKGDSIQGCKYLNLAIDGNVSLDSPEYRYLCR